MIIKSRSCSFDTFLSEHINKCRNPSQHSTAKFHLTVISLLFIVSSLWKQWVDITNCPGCIGSMFSDTVVWQVNAALIGDFFPRRAFFRSLLVFDPSMQSPCHKTPRFVLLTLFHFKTTEAHQLNNNNPDVIKQKKKCLQRAEGKKEDRWIIWWQSSERCFPYI